MLRALREDALEIGTPQARREFNEALALHLEIVGGGESDDEETPKVALAGEQDRQVRRILRGFAKHRTVVSQAYTGSGKTRMSLAVWVKLMPTPICWVIVPSPKLIVQYRYEFRKLGLKSSAKFLAHAGQKRTPELIRALDRAGRGKHRPMVIATTMHTLYRDMMNSESPISSIQRDHDLVVVDEFHKLNLSYMSERPSHRAQHDPRPTWERVVDFLDGPLRRSRCLLQSATPFPTGEVYWMTRPGSRGWPVPVVEMRNDAFEMPTFRFKGTFDLDVFDARDFADVERRYLKARAVAQNKKVPIRNRRQAQKNADRLRQQMRVTALGVADIRTEERRKRPTEMPDERWTRISEGAQRAPNLPIWAQTVLQIRDAQRETRCLKTMVLTEFVDTLWGIYATLVGAGIRVFWIDSKLGMRARALEAGATGRPPALPNMEAFAKTPLDVPCVLLGTFSGSGTGIDVPHALSIVTVGPPKTVGDLVQSAGRISRGFKQRELQKLGRLPDGPLRRVFSVVASPQGLSMAKFDQVDGKSSFAKDPVRLQWLSLFPYDVVKAFRDKAKLRAADYLRRFEKAIEGQRTDREIEEAIRSMAAISEARVQRDPEEILRVMRQIQEERNAVLRDKMRRLRAQNQEGQRMRMVKAVTGKIAVRNARRPDVVGPQAVPNLQLGDLAKEKIARNQRREAKARERRARAVKERKGNLLLGRRR